MSAAHQNADSVFKSYLHERSRVQAILGSKLETNVVVRLRIPSGLCTSFGLRVDLVVVGSSENAQVAGGSDGSGVDGSLVTNGSGVPGDGSLLHIVSSLGTDEETFVTNSGIDGGSGTLDEVDKGAGVNVWLLVVEVRPCAVCLGSGEEIGSDLALQALDQSAIEFDLGVERVGSRPTLGKGQSCSMVLY